VRSVNSYSSGASSVLVPHILGNYDALTKHNVTWQQLAEHTDIVLAFGGMALKNAMVAGGGISRHIERGAMRAARERGCDFLLVGPLRADLPEEAGAEWISPVPGTDTALMMALAHTLVADGQHDRAFLDRYTEGWPVFERYLMGDADGQPKNAAWAAPITGLSADSIIALARRLPGRRVLITVAHSLQRAEHGEQPVWMGAVLAAMLGQIGLPGGGYGYGLGAIGYYGRCANRVSGPTLPQGRNRVADFIPVARIADMLLHPGETFTYDGETHVYPDIRMIYWAGGNPYHHHQDLNRLLRAWQKPESIVVHEQFWTATAKRADVVLPATTSMERSDIGFSTLEGHLIAMRPLIPPQAEARDDFSIFADLAGRLGVEQLYTEGLDEQGWLRRLYDRCRDNAGRLGVALPDFETFWDRGIVDLGEHARPAILLDKFRADPERNTLPTPSGRIEIFSERVAGFGLPDCPGHPVWREPREWLGSQAAERFPLHLLSDQPERRLHSQLDSSPYSVAGKMAGREPVYINRQDAAARGIAAGEVVELFNDRGRCLAAAAPTDDVMPGVARLSTGAWFDPDPATGLEKHGNPNVLTLDAGASGLSQGCSAQTCLIDIRRVTGPVPDVTAFDPPDFVGR
jgi:biotin/methionine sulfoxide reductase